MLGRLSPDAGFKITGWSYRLFPPDASVITEPNRGSAFNSCINMSVVPTVDCLYLASARGLWKFSAGRAVRLR